MRLTVNGKPFDIAAEASDALTVDRLLRQVLPAAGEVAPGRRAACAVEVNRRVIPRREHATATLADGDSVEIVTLVGGG